MGQEGGRHRPVHDDNAVCVPTSRGNFAADGGAACGWLAGGVQGTGQPVVGARSITGLQVNSDKHKHAPDQ